MAAPQSEGEAQKLRFGPWLLSAVSSGNYPGLCWINEASGIFRVPWKHNARKDVTSSDVEIFKVGGMGLTSSESKVFKVGRMGLTSNESKVFKAWAKASGRYDGSYPEDPAKWKTNFRCALRSTRMFRMLEDNSKRGDNPHKVFAINSAALGHGEEGDFGSPDPAVDQQTLHQQAQPPVLDDLDELQWVLQHCNISPCDLGTLDPSWPPAVDAPDQDILLQPHPDRSQNTCLPPPTCQQWVPVEQQPPLGAYGPLDPMMLEDRGPMPLPCHPPEVMVPVLSPGEVMLFTPTTRPVPPPPPPEDNTGSIISSLDISIFYRGRLFHQEEVKGSQCLLVYQPCDPAVAGRPGCLVCFPSPAELADSKQRKWTEKLLGGVGLQLEQRANKILATRLKKCKIFWALSQQLESTEDSPSNMLCRDQETSIFDFNEFCTELRDFRNGQRQQSPDFTIYLCFGQVLSKDKSKDSKLILVKLVPKFCEYWHTQVQLEGASSLDSGTVSLQLSDSFNLFELIEQYTMEMD
ncbi:interferon regulatory factor 7 [Limosa lapponica baueri]|uniref:Interferon regulatory factor 7 n=1 Tax=Limosa lapponica baueri TaxID=1758121 RepID=A0A2I0ULG4_LIMLA|nr:interferon regulatory factor 7 [Limosa lapponica baueri]